MSIKKQLLILVGMAVGSLVAMAISVHLGLASLKDGYRQSSERSRDAALAIESSYLGAQYYQIFADAIINRNLDDARKRLSELDKEANSDLATLAREADTPEEKALVARATTDIQALRSMFESELFPTLEEHAPLPERIQSIDGKADASVRTIREDMQRIAESMNAESEDAAAAYDRTTWKVSALSSAIAGIVGVVLLAVGVLTLRSILASVDQVAGVAQRIARGDLAQEIRVEGPAETAALLRSCQAMQQGLRDVVGQLQSDAGDLATMGTQMATATSQLTVATSRQSESAAAIAATVEQLATSIASIEEQASAIQSSANESGGEGSEAIRRMIESSRETITAVHQTAGEIGRLHELSSQISSVVGVIREVADQTNLLALNAAIEAARAGEQGRGFAVVADEVRKLAERTGQSTREIGDMIERVQDVTQVVARSIDAAVRHMTRVDAMSRDADAAISSLKEQTGAILRSLRDVGTALQEQRSATESMARGVEDSAQVSEENAAIVNETASAANNLSQLALALQQTSSRFRLP